MTFYGRIREKGPDPTGSGSATLLKSLLDQYKNLFRNKLQKWLGNSVFRIRIRIQGCFGSRSGFQIRILIQVFKNDYYDYDDYD